MLGLIFLFGCRELSTVTIADSLISNDDLHELAFALGPTLAQLDLSGSRGFDAVGLKAFAAFCPRLRDLHLAGVGLTDDGMSKLAQWCPDLRTLVIDAPSEEADLPSADGEETTGETTTDDSSLGITAGAPAGVIAEATAGANAGPNMGADTNATPVVTSGVVVTPGDTFGVTERSLKLLSPECRVERVTPRGVRPPAGVLAELGKKDDFDPLKELLNQRYLFEATQKVEYQPLPMPKHQGEDEEAAAMEQALDSWKRTRKSLRLFFDREDVELSIMAVVLIYAVIILIDLSIVPMKMRSPPPPFAPPPMPPWLPGTPLSPPSLPPALPPFGRPCDWDFQLFYLLDVFFLSFFMLELAARLVAWGVVFFVSEPINALDGLVVVVSFAMVIFLGVSTGVCEDPTASTSSLSQLVSILRLVRLFRLITIFNKVHRSRKSANLLHKKRSHKRIGSKIERVLDILKREKGECDSMADRSKYDFVLDMIVSDRLYSVTVTQTETVTAEMAGFLNNFSTPQIGVPNSARAMPGGDGDEGGDESDKKPRVLRRRRKSVALAEDLETAWVDQLVESDPVARLLASAAEWDFDIFALHELVGPQLMPCMVMHFIRAYSLDNQLRLNCPNMVRFLVKLSAGYKDVPFHNYVHACDVVQTTAFFLNCRKVLPNVDALDMLSMLLAAAMHDHNHPGLTNVMLVNSRDPLAILYNDLSVLENHHLASSWRLLNDLQPLEGFSAAQMGELRATVCQAVLGTDMKYHFEHLAKFKARASIDGFENGGRSEQQERNDQRLLLTCCLHAADVSNPFKPWATCRQWAARVMAEFFRQGDLETKLGLPISPFMDRATTDISKCQLGFVNFVLRPFFEEWCGWLGDDIREEICGYMQENLDMWEREGEGALGEELLHAVKSSTLPKMSEVNCIIEPKMCAAEAQAPSVGRASKRWLAGGSTGGLLSSRQHSRRNTNKVAPHP